MAGKDGEEAADVRSRVKREQTDAIREVFSRRGTTTSQAKAEIEAANPDLEFTPANWLDNARNGMTILRPSHAGAFAAWGNRDPADMFPHLKAHPEVVPSDDPDRRRRRLPALPEEIHAVIGTAAAVPILKIVEGTGGPAAEPSLRAMLDRVEERIAHRHAVGYEDQSLKSQPRVDVPEAAEDWRSRTGETIDDMGVRLLGRRADEFGFKPIGPLHAGSREVLLLVAHVRPDVVRFRYRGLVTRWRGDEMEKIVRRHAVDLPGHAPAVVERAAAFNGTTRMICDTLVEASCVTAILRVLGGPAPTPRKGLLARLRDRVRG